MSVTVGLMQGRLSPMTNNLIQSFPWESWENEFIEASQNKFYLIEWTLDEKDLYDNPIMNNEGHKKILLLCKNNLIKINSLTADCMMQKPFWKAEYKNRKELQKDFVNVIISCSRLKLKYIVVPLVDNGSIETKEQEIVLINFLLANLEFINKCKIKIIFESDFKPSRLEEFINKLSSPTFGINYDMGNSASLGYNVNDEFIAYGDRIYNVHVKDRLLKGKTVFLGNGNVNFDKVFKCLKSIEYKGDLILQTARAKNNDHLKILNIFKDFVTNFVIKYELN